VGGLGGPFQILLYLQEGVVLREGLQDAHAEEGRTVGNGVLRLYFFEDGEVVGVGPRLRLQHRVVDPAREVSSDNISQKFALGCPLGFDWYGLEDPLVEAIDLADLQRKCEADLALVPFY